MPELWFNFGKIELILPRHICAALDTREHIVCEKRMKLYSNQDGQAVRTRISGYCGEVLTSISW
jgi:hypothetical protein